MYRSVALGWISYSTPWNPQLGCCKDPEPGNPKDYIFSLPTLDLENRQLPGLVLRRCGPVYCIDIVFLTSLLLFRLALKPVQDGKPHQELRASSSLSPRTARGTSYEPSRRCSPKFPWSTEPWLARRLDLDTMSFHRHASYSVTYIYKGVHSTSTGVGRLWVLNTFLTSRRSPYWYDLDVIVLAWVKWPTKADRYGAKGSSYSRSENLFRPHLWHDMAEEDTCGTFNCKHSSECFM